MKATGYLAIEPVWRGEQLVGAKLTRLTQGKPTPSTLEIGTAVVRLTVDIPDRVFKPYLAEAQATATESNIGTVKVVIEPYQDEEDGGE